MSDRAGLVRNFADAVGAFVDFNVLSQACPNCGGEDKEALFPLVLISAIGYVYSRRLLHASKSRCFICHRF
jgi:hypothetical protein